jgi:proteic killer suppression protein
MMVAQVAPWQLRASLVVFFTAIRNFRKQWFNSVRIEFFDSHLLLIKICIFAVIITFSDRKLKELVNDDRKMFRKLGQHRATLLRRRLSQLADAENLEDVRHLPGHFHELKNDRKGQWSCDLDQPYRLIFVPHESPIPTSASGHYLWTAITGVEIIEIVDYH